MRKVIPPFATLMVLLVATVFAWNRLYHADAGMAAIVLPQGSPIISAGAHGPPAWQASLPGELDGRSLLVRFQLSAQNLRRGPADWQDGRLHLEWMDRHGGLIRREFLGSIWDDRTYELISGVLHPPNGSHRARIHLENLGTSGTCHLSSFQALPVRHRPSMVALILLIAAGWLTWAAHVAGNLDHWRSWLAGGVWMVAAYGTVLPGPWSMDRPLLGDFKGIASDQSAELMTPGDFQSAPSFPGKSEPSNLLLRWKIRLQPLRPLLHGLLFLAPTFTLLLLSRPRRVLALTGLLALLIEGAQYALGFGFEPTDLLDLANDAFGILAGFVVFAVCRRLWLRGVRLPSNRVTVPPS